MSKRFIAMAIFAGTILGLLALSIIHLPIKRLPAIDSTAITTPTPISVKNLQQSRLNFIQQKATTIDDITKALGTPSETEMSSDGTKILIYNPDKNNQYRIYLIQDKTLVATDTNNKNNQLPPTEQDYILYDQSFRDTGYAWHIFPQNGVGYLLNIKDNSSLMSQYFQPMTYDQYLQSIAKFLNLSETQSTYDVESFQ